MIQNLKEIIVKVIRRNFCEVKIEDGRFILKLNNKTLECPVDEISNLIDSINFDLSSDDLKIMYGNCHEVLIESNGPIPTMEESIKITDVENSIIYTIGSPSVEFALTFLLRANNNKELLRRYLLSPYSNFFEKRIIECETIFDFLKLLVRRVDTISLTSEANLSDKEVKSRLDAFTFDISFNLGISITQVNYLSELFIPLRQHSRRKNISEIDPPRRKYVEDLIYHYQMGMSTHQPALKFTSFYHVIEYFFSEVFNEQIVEAVRREITSPKFSSKRNSDITKLIKSIKNNLRVEFDENVGKSEAEALKLTLSKYLNVSELIETLRELDESYLIYYKTTEVPFASGCTVDLENTNMDKVLKDMANRIYKTRNAVVHSKADSKDCYVPFKHEVQLLKEIPLIQIIAEEIIINTSKLL